jgi:hypothetical protein
VETSPGPTAGDGGTAAGSPQAGDAGENWEERLAEVLRTEHPRPETEPTVDPEHEEYVEDSQTESRGELTCTGC